MDWEDLAVIPIGGPRDAVMDLDAGLIYTLGDFGRTVNSYPIAGGDPVTVTLPDDHVAKTLALHDEGVAVLANDTILRPFQAGYFERATTLFTGEIGDLQATMLPTEVHATFMRRSQDGYALSLQWGVRGFLGDDLVFRPDTMAARPYEGWTVGADAALIGIPTSQSTTWVAVDLVDGQAALVTEIQYPRIIAAVQPAVGPLTQSLVDEILAAEEVRQTEQAATLAAAMAQAASDELTSEPDPAAPAETSATPDAAPFTEEEATVARLRDEPAPSSSVGLGALVTLGALGAGAAALVMWRRRQPGRHS